MSIPEAALRADARAEATRPNRSRSGACRGEPPSRAGASTPRRRRYARELLALLGIASGTHLVAGCGTADQRADLLTDSSYVEVMARLARVRREFTPRDSLRADSARRAILSEAGVEASQLSRYAASHGADAAHMTAVWTAINLRVLTLDSLESAAEEQEEGRQEEAEEERRHRDKRRGRGRT